MNDRACLLLHGFTGGPYEVEPLAQALQLRGYDCDVPTLPGHELQPQSLRSVSSADWLHGAEQAAARLASQYGRFDVVGFSMGGLLAAYIGNRFPIGRLVLLSPALIYVSPGRMLQTLARRKQLHQPAVVHSKLGTPLRAIWQFSRLVHRLKTEYSVLSAPTLIVQGALDPIIHPYSANVIARQLRGDWQLRFMPNSRHLLCHDKDYAEVEQAVLHFLLGNEKEST